MKTRLHIVKTDIKIKTTLKQYYVKEEYDISFMYS